MRDRPRPLFILTVLIACCVPLDAQAGPSEIERLIELVKELQAEVTELKLEVARQGRELETTRRSVRDQEKQLALLRDNSVLELDGMLTLENARGGPTARFSGVNLQVVNGLGGTETMNGLGNLIVGYDEPRDQGDPECSLGAYVTQGSCENAGWDWGIVHRSGSHNLVVGLEHNYPVHAGVVFGRRNTVNGFSASVTGGAGNTAATRQATVSGGMDNVARKAGPAGGGAGFAVEAPSVHGGRQNLAAGRFASVGGGLDNVAHSWGGSITGGRGNEVQGFDNPGQYPSIVGGSGNFAFGCASVLGGSNNEARGGGADGNQGCGSVAGGAGNRASGVGVSVLGGVNQTEMDPYETIPPLP